LDGYRLGAAFASLLVTSIGFKIFFIDSNSQAVMQHAAHAKNATLKTPYNA
jgi:hypothetical protein